MPAVAVTDTNNLFGALEFSVTLAEAGIQPIHGVQIALRFEPDEQTQLAAPVVLLVQNEEGYLNLLKLSTAFYLQPSSGNAHGLSLDDLKPNSSGLICLTGGALGPIGLCALEGRSSFARRLLEDIASVFSDRTYVELQRHQAEGFELTASERRSEPELIDLAFSMGLPLVATNDVYFPNSSLFEAHDAMICIAEGAFVDQSSGRRRLTPENYFKSQDEMCALFADQPEAVSNTVEIARRCSFNARRRPPILPKFTDNEAEEMRRQAKEGLQRRLTAIQLSADEEKYWERLDYELGVIESMGFAGYFLIVADFIKWAKSQDIPVGAGRGSGAGSLVAFALTITDLDPLRFDLLFERFLNPERISMPDFDVDFCQDRRDEVIRYVQQKYGKDRVAHIITYGALMSRAAVRDIGRVLRLPYSKVDNLSKLIPRKGMQNMPLDVALAEEPRLKAAYDEDPAVKRLFDYAEPLVGLLRNASTHAAGIVIGDRPLDELVPLYLDPRSTVAATQFSMKWVEQAGLVKFDFLGLKTLTVIKSTVNMLAENGIQVDIDNLPLDDERAFALCTAAETVAVFQLESTGMQDTLRNLKPNCIDDIIALVALYRPGPMENISEYCLVKHGKKKRKKQHETIDHIVAETHGIIVYQEQVMQIAQSMAGYSLGQADLLRRAIGKKIKSAMDAEKPRFLSGAKEKGVTAKTAEEVWNLMARFAEYGFPKAHAAAYALVTYQTAWLKANYPVEYMASAMNYDSGDTDKLRTYKDDLKRLKITLQPPCVNQSQTGFSVEDGSIRYGLAALRKAGGDAMRQIVETRRDERFRDIFDFAARVNLKLVGKRQLETLAQAGAFDCVDSNRRKIFESAEDLIVYSSAKHDEASLGQMSIFGDDESDLPKPDLDDRPMWDPVERSHEELSAFGYYFSSHPLDQHRKLLNDKGVQPYAEALTAASPDQTSFLIAGIISEIRTRRTKQGDQFAFLELSDASGNFDVVVFSDEFKAARGRLQIGTAVLINVSASRQQDVFKFRANIIEFIDDIVANQSRGLRIYFNETSTPELVRSVLQRREAAGDDLGEIRFCPYVPGRVPDTEIIISGRHPIGAKMKKAVTSLNGIVRVDEI